VHKPPPIGLRKASFAKAGTAGLSGYWRIEHAEPFMLGYFPVNSVDILCAVLDAVVNNWSIYILRCADDTLYTGVSTNVSRRVEEHNAGAPPGARYTSGRRPVVLVYVETAANRSAAQRREREIKALERAKKLALIAAQ